MALKLMCVQHKQRKDKGQKIAQTLHLATTQTNLHSSLRALFKYVGNDFIWFD